MGWRAWDAYDREAHERWRALPWHEPLNRRTAVGVAVIVALLAAYLCASIGW